jgi:polyvinyl alcohol dehydrogenase (cytochrome)
VRTGDDDELVGFGQKSGTYWALDPKTGNVVWKTVLGPAGATLGGIEWALRSTASASTRRSRIRAAFTYGSSLPAR